MSRGARWLLGVFCLFFAGTFAVTASSATETMATLAVWLCAGFCVLIAVACFSSVARGPAVRVIGSVVFLLCLTYLIFEIRKGIWRPYEGRASEHWVNAIWGLFVFGLPGLYVALCGRYPIWGKGAKAFLGEEFEHKRDRDEKIIKS